MHDPVYPLSKRNFSTTSRMIRRAKLERKDSLTSSDLLGPPRDQLRSVVSLPVSLAVQCLQLAVMINLDRGYDLPGAHGRRPSVCL